MGGVGLGQKRARRGRVGCPRLGSQMRGARGQHKADLEPRLLLPAVGRGEAELRVTLCPYSNSGTGSPSPVLETGFPV